MNMSRILGAVGFAIILSACSSSSDSGSDAAAAGSGGSAGTGAGGSGIGGSGIGGSGTGGSGTGGSGTGGGTGGSAGGSIGPAGACPTAKYKTLVVVGDSISDVGGSGPNQEPFYRTLLVHNDDTLYPTWKGIDLATCWGLADANVVKVSVGGAIATETKGSQSVLLDQTKKIPTMLEGPVLVVGTIGGNDVTAGLKDVLLGTPAQQQADVDAFIKGFGDAMTELTKPDRFGPGVKVDVLITNIYDPSGGSGDFTYAPGMTKCGGALGLWPPKTPTDPALKTWNDAMSAEAAKHPGVHLLDLQTAFKGHEVSQPDPTCWFHDDCIHPNTAGHEHIRELFWTGITALK
jgi:lysophospholipase L1-like esterase